MWMGGRCRRSLFLYNGGREGEDCSTVAESDLHISLTCEAKLSFKLPGQGQVPVL